MGKEKEMLRKILQNTEWIMKKLDVNTPVKETSGAVKQAPVKKLPVKKTQQLKKKG